MQCRETFSPKNFISRFFSPRKFFSLDIFFLWTFPPNIYSSSMHRKGFSSNPFQIPVPPDRRSFLPKIYGSRMRLQNSYFLKACLVWLKYWNLEKIFPFQTNCRKCFILFQFVVKVHQHFWDKDWALHDLKSRDLLSCELSGCPGLKPRKCIDYTLYRIQVGVASTFDDKDLALWRELHFCKGWMLSPAKSVIFPSHFSKVKIREPIALC